MKSLFRKINTLLNLIGLHVISKGGWENIQQRSLQLDELQNNKRLWDIDFEILSLINSRSENARAIQISKLIEIRDKSCAAFRQDLMALTLNDFKKNGVFIEIGACDGLATSNSFLLEKEFGWRGLLVEPARIWHQDLIMNRSADLEFRCAWSHDGEKVNFVEKESAGRSGIEETTIDSTPIKVKYEVETVTLRKILEEKPYLREVSFLSIDTEGSEYEVLLGFPFETCKPKYICVEHNYEEEKRSRIRELLNLHGYINILQSHSYVDDWYYINSNCSPIRFRLSHEN